MADDVLRLGPRWSEVDFEAHTLVVRQTLTRVGGRLVFSEPKTDRSRRRVPVPEQAMERLKRHRARQAGERLAAGERWRDHGLVFASTIGTPLEPRNIDRSTYAHVLPELERTAVDDAARRLFR